MTFHITQLVHDRTNRYVQGNVCLIDEADGCLYVVSNNTHRKRRRIRLENVVEGARPTEGQKQVSPKKPKKSEADWLAKAMKKKQAPPKKSQPVWLTEAMERSGLSETEIKKRAEACGCTLQEAAEALTE